MNHSKNITPDHMLSKNRLCLHAAVQYVFLFLVLAIILNFTELHTLTQATHSYALFVFLISVNPSVCITNALIITPTLS